MARDKRRPFTVVYEDHIWTVYGFLGYRLNSRELAEDLTQATFERALRAWERYDPERASERTWLLAIARNLLIDHSRQTRPADPSARDPEERLSLVESPEGHPGGSELDAGMAADLQTAVDSLSDRERDLIALRFGADCTGPEIAQMTGLTLANVQQILSRALRRMRSELSGPTEERRS